MQIGNGGNRTKNAFFEHVFYMNFRLDWAVCHQTPSDCHDACHNANGKRSTFPRISVQKCSTRSGSAEHPYDYKLRAKIEKILRICPPQAPKNLIKYINFHRKYFKNTIFSRLRRSCIPYRSNSLKISEKRIIP